MAVGKYSDKSKSLKKGKERNLFFRLLGSVASRNKNESEFREIEEIEELEENAAIREIFKDNVPPQDEQEVDEISQGILDFEENIMKDSENYIEAIRTNLRLSEVSEAGEAYFSDFTMDSSVPTETQRDFFSDLQKKAKSIMKYYEEKFDYAFKMQLQQEVSRRKAEGLDEIEIDEMEIIQMIEPIPIDSEAYVKISPNKMEAWIFVFPPKNGGKEISVDMLNEAIKNANVNYGLDNDIIEKIAKEKIYLKFAVIARGKPALDGKDGYVIDHFPRDNKIRLEEDEESVINYKNLNWINPLEENEIICDIIPPTKHEDGIKVNGDKLRAKRGLNPSIPKGTNTKINDDRTALVSCIQGTVSFKSGKFKVEKVLIIRGDVNVSVGNIDTIGDVIVNGDVLGGFSVKATGNVVVKGMIEGATIVAKENIQIGMGINGENTGFLKAGGEIRSRYIENCTVEAKGNIYSDSVVNCKINCDENLFVTSGHGIIIGGNIKVLKSINANVIGNENLKQTFLTVGMTPGILEEKNKIEKSMNDIDEKMNAIEKDIKFLSAEKDETVESRKKLNSLKLNLSMNNIEKMKLLNRLEEINKSVIDLKHCNVKCKTIYPPTNVTIKSDTFIVKQVENMCKIYYSKINKEVQVGVK